MKNLKLGNFEKEEKDVYINLSRSSIEQLSKLSDEGDNRIQKRFGQSAERQLILFLNENMYPEKGDMFFTLTSVSSKEYQFYFTIDEVIWNAGAGDNGIGIEFVITLKNIEELK